MKKFYRYMEYDTSNGVQVDTIEYKSIKKTPCGNWIVEIDNFGFEEDFYEPKKYWVSNTSKKKRAYPNKKDALESFLYRKLAQIKILEGQLKLANAAFNEGIKMMDENDTKSKHKKILMKNRKRNKHLFTNLVI